jgi:hypothetical protein
MTKFNKLGRVTPSLPPRGRHPNGSTPLTPFVISSVSKEDLSSIFRQVIVIFTLPIIAATKKYRQIMKTE